MTKEELTAVLLSRITIRCMSQRRWVLLMRVENSWKPIGVFVSHAKANDAVIVIKDAFMSMLENLG